MRKNLTKHIQEKVKESYKAIAAEFDATRKKPWQEFHHFLGYVRRGAKVLDLGCGNGRLYEFLKSKEVTYTGVDNNSELLKKARANYPDATFELADMANMQVEEGGFDNVFAIASFHHLPSKVLRKKAVNNMHKALKEDGILILTVWNLFQRRYFGALLSAVASWVLHLGFKYAWNDLWISWGNAPVKRYYHAFRPKELRRHFKAGDFEIEEFYFTKKGNRVRFFRSYNLVLIARKK